MPRSDESRELGGLARSIDALFSSEVSAPEEEGPDGGARAPSLDESPSEPADRVLADNAGFGDDAWTLADEEAPEPGVAAEVPPPAPARARSTATPDPDGLAAAVDDFLADATDAAAERLKEVATPLLEHYALDPLADAAERLVIAAGDPPDGATLAAAESVMNPAVASKLIHRMGAATDPDRRAEYVVMAQRLGEIMAVALRGALTDATDRSARRAYYDALIAMGETSRPIIEEMVDDDNRFLVRNAVAILGEIGGERSVELVTSALANTDPRVRREALQSLARLGVDDEGQLIVAFLDDSDSGVRVAAATAAGALKVERALRPVLGLLEAEQDPDASIPLLHALGQLGDPGAVPAIEKYALKKRYSKGRSDIRIAAYRALHNIGTPHARELLERAHTDKDVAVQAAVRELAGAA